MGMKKILIIAFAALAAVCASAQTAKPAAKQKATTSQSSATTAAQLMKRAAQRLEAAPSLTVRFTATTGDGHSASGTIVMARSKFKLTMPGQNVWYDGQLMHSYSAATAETSLTEPTPDELLEINPFDILHQWSRGYDARMVKTANGAKCVELTSKRKGSAVSRALVTLSPATGLPTAIDAVMANSATMKIKVTAAEQGRALPASAFAYPAKDYPGVEVVDLR